MPGFEGLGRIIIFTGLVLVVLGVLITFAGGLNLGRLPGDIVFKRGNFTFYFPLATSIILSVLLTLIFSLFFRR